MLNWIRALFERPVETPAEKAAFAGEVEKAELSIEQRMSRIQDRISKGGYRNISDDDKREIIEDLDLIIEFVDHALTILEGPGRIRGIDASLRRLRGIRTRVRNLLNEPVVQDLRESA
jgi:hypothetical protein